MRKKLLACVCAYLACAGISAAQERMKVKSEESLFLDLQKIGLGTLSEFEEKKRFLGTVQMEKEDLQRRMLDNVYESAFDCYLRGNYEESRDLAAKILSIDPNHEDAGMLLEASNQLIGGKRGVMSERVMIEDRFKSAMALYTEGRVAEAYRKMREVEKLSPNNIKAKYWLERMKDDLRLYYIKEGESLYRARDLKGSLDNFYDALFIRPKDQITLQWIIRIEDELRQILANERLKSALELYARGMLVGACEGLKRVLEIQPGDPKATKLLREVKSEVEQGYITSGKKLYSARLYNEAIAEWNRARPYSAGSIYLDKLVARAREQMRLEANEKRRRSEAAARRAEEEEARRRAEEDARIKAEEDAAKNKPIQITAPQGVTEESRLSAQKHYLEGLKSFQNANYEKARDEWTIAKQLDPENSDYATGLKRIEQIMAGSQ